MQQVPNIDRAVIADGIVARLPLADVRTQTISPEHDSWVIEVRYADRMVSVSWGPLSGFGATDHKAYREDSNPFGAYDWPLETEEQAVSFVVDRLNE